VQLLSEEGVMMGILKKKFRSVRNCRPGFTGCRPVMQLYVRCCFRVRIVDPNRYIEDARGVVSVTWHNRLMFFAVLFPLAMRRRTVAVVSASRDGQYIADFISILGLKSLRGSSSKKGANAYRAESTPSGRVTTSVSLRTDRADRVM
jgi:hypothetical protein